MGKILVTGGTGKLGTAVVENLLDKIAADNISVLVRSSDKAHSLQSKGVEVIEADYNDYNSLVRAFTGIDKLYFVSSSDVLNRLPQHQNVVHAAKEARVGHLFYTSAQRKHEDGTSAVAYVADAHWRTDEMIRESGLVFTILKHGLYTEILPMFLGAQVIETGMIFLPAGVGKTSYSSRLDLAQAGANLLMGEGHAGKVYELGGTESLSFQDIADTLSELSGKAIRYISPSPEEFKAQLETFGLPREEINSAVTFCIAISQGEFDFPGNELELILGRKPQSVKSFLKGAYGL